MTDPQHDLEQQLNDAAQWCLTRGERLTDQRREVLSLLLAAPGSLKAYDILAQIQKQKPNAAPPTVYRALDFLIAVGLIHKLDSMNAFVACRDFSSHLHRHGLMLICDRCNNVVELCDEALAERLTAVAAAAGFTVKPQDIEVKGLCATCREAEEHGA
ncbi:transcriptional repressor [Chitinimonas lacunae]|uniref:Ferric uptake regulation protein n=1 Tax=Chitinimonas lacunae TaxID=1963018 RepID=A0ABV8MR80_9NEIS